MKGSDGSLPLHISFEQSVCFLPRVVLKVHVGLVPKRRKCGTCLQESESVLLSFPRANFPSYRAPR